MSPTSLLNRLRQGSSPFCVSSGHCYLDESCFDPQAAESIAEADRKKRLYCFERGGEVLAALRWEDLDGVDTRVAALALRGGENGPLREDECGHVHAAAVVALGIAHYRAKLEGRSGCLLAAPEEPGCWAPDLKALGFVRDGAAWRFDLQTKTRLGARLALLRLRCSSRR